MSRDRTSDQRPKATLQKEDTGAATTTATTFTLPSRLKIGPKANTSTMPETARPLDKGKQPMNRRVEDPMDLFECGAWSADLPEAPYESVAHDPTLYEYEPEPEPSSAAADADKAPAAATSQPRKIAKCKKRTRFSSESPRAM